MVIRIRMHVNWCVIYPTQLTCLSLLIASYITRFTNLVRFCCVLVSLILQIVVASFYKLSLSKVAAIYYCLCYLNRTLLLDSTLGVFIKSAILYHTSRYSRLRKVLPRSKITHCFYLLPSLP